MNTTTVNNRNIRSQKNIPEHFLFLLTLFTRASINKGGVNITRTILRENQ
ncbi:MAG: hypothetical protein OEZ15_07185 [Gammaproteobacteria bacterium]|nr:hypothetical protein [Gammaproteobacteria bacterium]